MFSNEPGLVPRQMLLTLIPDPLRRSVGNATPDRGKTRFELSFVPVRQVMFCQLTGLSRPYQPCPGCQAACGKFANVCNVIDLPNRVNAGSFLLFPTQASDIYYHIVYGDHLHAC